MCSDLVDSVGNSVSRVELDGGEDSITGWSSSNSGDWSSVQSWNKSWSSGVVEGGQSWSSHWKGVVGQGESSSNWVSSIGQGGESWSSHNSVSLSLSLAVGEGGESSVGDNWSSGDLVGDLSWGDHIRLDDWRMGNGGGWSEDWGSGVGQRESSSIVQRKSSDGWSSDNGSNWSNGSSRAGNDSGLSLASLSLRSSGLGSSKSLSMGSLGSSDLWGVLNGDRDGEVKDWSLERSGGRDGGSDWEVGAGNSEAIDWVSHIVDSLEETIGVNVLVGACCHSIGVPGLSPG